MGAGSSLPSRETLTSETNKTKTILNGILQFMLSESDLLDMYALASDKRCDDYAVFTAESLDSFFKKIQMSPAQTKDGTLYFQDLYTLKKLSGKTGEKHKENCLRLSRFFIRILHIFSALSLTIIDMEIPQDNRTLNEIGKRDPSLKGRIREESIRSIPFLRTGQVGGAIPNLPTVVEYERFYVGRGTKYEVLNQYISIDRQMGYYYFDKYRTLYLYANSLTPKETINPKFTYSYTKPTKNGNKPSKPIDIEGYFTFEKKDGSPTLQITVGITSPREYETVSTDTLSYDGSHYSWNNKKIPDYIMYKIQDAVGESKNTNERRITRRSNLNKVSKEISSEFQVTGILDALKTPPKAYCVARALQLLSPESIFYSRDGSAARTQICDTSFTLLGKGSLPKPNEAITTSASIMSLYLLFYDTLDKATPIISQQTLPKYREFVKMMRAVYQEETTATNTTVGMTNIKNIRNPLCTGKSGAHTLTDQDAINSLRSSAAALLSKQLKHTEKVMNILKKLFVITPTKPILLHPAVETGGMAAIEAIAAEARDLLVDYYSSCEITYRDAVQDLKERVEKNPALFTV
jgi:hypothetical protein